MERDFSDLELDQLVSVFDNLGEYASDLKDSVTLEIVGRLFLDHNSRDCSPPIDDAKAQQGLKRERIVEKVKDHPSYIEAFRRAADEQKKRSLDTKSDS